MNSCPECGSPKIIHAVNEIACRDCGLVLDDALIEEAQISPTIKNQAEDPYLVTAASKAPEGRIYKESWLLTTREKNLRQSMQKIDFIASKLKLSTAVTQDSKLILKKALYSNLAIGRNTTNIIYACVYIACNQHGTPKTPLELTAFTEIRNVDLLKAYRIIKRCLQLKTKPIDPQDLLPRFASKLQLKPATITVAAEILMKVKDEGVGAGKKPETLLAGALYIACQKSENPRTQRQIANTLGVLEVTIRKISKEITTNFFE